MSSLELWPRPVSGSRPRLLLRRLLRDPLLPLQVAFLVAVVLALARPLWPGGVAGGRRIVLVFDGSASMGAIEEQGRRFDLARARALEILEGLRRRDRVQLLYAGARPRFVTEPSADRAQLRRLIQSLEPTAGTADLQAAALMALAVTEGRNGDLVYLLSDGTAGASLPAEMWLARLRYVQLGTARDNLAIARLATRPSRVSPYDHDLFLELVNHSAAPRQAVLIVTAGDRQVLREPLRLLAGERRSRTVSGLGASGTTTLEARLEVEDALPVDDRAWAVLDSSGYSVLLVSRGSRFLEEALRLDPLVRVSRLDPRSYSGDVAPDFDVVVFAGVVPGQPAVRPRLVFATAGYGRRKAGLEVPSVARDHALASWLGVAGPPVARLVLLPADAGRRVLLEERGRPVVLAREEGIRELVVGLDPTDPLWGRTLSFPVFVANAVRWLASADSRSASQIVAGEALEWRLPELAAGSTVTVEEPSGSRVLVPLAGDRLSFARTADCGVYTVRGDGFERSFAVNPAALRESDLRPVWRGPVENAGGVLGRRAAEASVGDGESVLSRWLLLIALALLSLEWLLWRWRDGGGWREA